MRIELSGKTAVVTGSTELGFANAKGLAEAGAAVIVNGRKSATVEAAVERLLQVGPAQKHRGVASDPARVGLRGACRRRAHRDILVNNVGMYRPKDFLDTSEEDWERYFAVNVMSGVRLSRSYLPQMRKKGWGRVLFVSSRIGAEHSDARNDTLRTADEGKPRSLSRFREGLRSAWRDQA